MAWLFAAKCALFVECGEHETDVWCQQVVHLVAQRGLAEQLAAAHEVADGHVEVGVATAPVGDLGEGVGHQDVLHGRAEQTLLTEF